MITPNELNELRSIMRRIHHKLIDEVSQNANGKNLVTITYPTHYHDYIWDVLGALGYHPEDSTDVQGEMTVDVTWAEQ